MKNDLVNIFFSSLLIPFVFSFKSLDFLLILSIGDNFTQLNISNMKQTFVKAENYFSKIKNLKEGEIYVSDVIGEYVGTKVLGEFTKPKAKSRLLAFA